MYKLLFYNTLGKYIILQLLNVCVVLLQQIFSERLVGHFATKLKQYCESKRNVTNYEAH